MCDINQRYGHIGGKKDNRLVIDKKPPNLMRTEEEN